jgi:hypothetical protein
VADEQAIHRRHESFGLPARALEPTFEHGLERALHDLEVVVPRGAQHLDIVVDVGQRPEAPQDDLGDRGGPATVSRREVEDSPPVPVARTPPPG